MKFPIKPLTVVMAAASILAAAAPRLSAKTAIPAPAPAANDNVVMMEKMEVKAVRERAVLMDKLEVNAPRTHWKHAQSAHFEILSNRDDTEFIAGIVKLAEQIITLYEKSCPDIFTPRLDLPSKLLFIQNRSGGLLFWREEENTLRRFFSPISADSSQADFNERMAGTPFNGRKQEFDASYNLSSLGKHNDEQLVIVDLLSKFESPPPRVGASFVYKDPSLGHAADLAITYLNECALIRANGKKLPWLVAALNAMRGHQRGGWFLANMPQGFLSNKSYTSNGCTGGGSLWIDVNDNNSFTLGRYCLECEVDAVIAATDFHSTNSKYWKNFILSPDISLGDVFNSTFVLWVHDAMEMQRQFTMQREARDFLYYCLFVPAANARRAFANLVRTTAMSPIDETLFKKCFGVGYDKFKDDMYAYFRTISKDNPNYEYNPWGRPYLRINMPPDADPAKPIEFRPARPGEATRIISDWFDVCGTAASSHDSLLQAYERSPQAAEDPQFIATVALNEARYGDRAKAITLLEKAIRAKVTRPNVYRTLSRLYLEDILDRKGADYRLTAPELQDILNPLIIAFNQPQPNPQNYTLFATVFEHTDLTPDETYQAIITEGCRRFPDNIDMLEKILPAFAKRGYKTEAITLAEQSAQTPMPPEKKQQLDNLLKMLKNLKAD